jgi:quercetin dioxygenase-like cupin family protein
MLVIKGTEVPARDLGTAGVQSILLGAPRGDGSPLLLGVTTVEAGKTSALIAHDVAEVAYVADGTGAVVTDTDQHGFGTGDSVLIEPHCWHAIRADTAGDVRMIFVFPTPDIPATRHWNED